MDAQSRPLSEETRSGAIIAEIESKFPLLGFYRTNLVKCPPVKNEKLRYPTRDEMSACCAHLRTEWSLTSPDLVILLGKQVIDFCTGWLGIELPSFGDAFAYRPQKDEGNGPMFVGVHHPSFVNVYRRKRLTEYTQGVARVISKTCNK